MNNQGNPSITIIDWSTKIPNLCPKGKYSSNHGQRPKINKGVLVGGYKVKGENEGP